MLNGNQLRGRINILLFTYILLLLIAPTQ